MGIDIGLIPAFGAGLLSFLSPCILPLLPPHRYFLAGSSLDELTAECKSADLARRVVGQAMAFVIGFTCVFVVLGAGASAVGRLVSEHSLYSRAFPAW